MDWLSERWLSEHWLELSTVFNFLLAFTTSVHAVLHKRDPRAAVAWLGLAWLAPLVGSTLYWLFGVNRIQRRAAQLMRRGRAQLASAAPPPTSEQSPAHELPLRSLRCAVDRLVPRPLLPGNSVEALENGDAAFPEMLDAIHAAERTLVLATYIFDTDETGALFIDALARAHARGVSVRVLIDAIGAHYSWSTAPRQLRRRGVPVAVFLPTRIPIETPFINLRNHRKILIADGAHAYTGGMNIRHGHVLDGDSSHPVRDLHFCVRGPVVAQLMDCFLEDWAFTTGETLSGEAWYPPLPRVGDVWARAITDGPDVDFDVLRHVILAALASAERSVRIVTPYFVPDVTLLTALNVAALRGVRVELVLPERGNIRLAQWATNALLSQILKHGCRVYSSPPPFDHTKLLIVDDSWILLGSANWDARSLRLNFELDMEIYHDPLAHELTALVDQRIAAAREVDLAMMDSRPVLVRLRDGVAKLFTPYL